MAVNGDMFRKCDVESSDSSDLEVAEAPAPTRRHRLSVPVAVGIGIAILVLASSKQLHKPSTSSEVGSKINLASAEMTTSYDEVQVQPQSSASAAQDSVATPQNHVDESSAVWDVPVATSAQKQAIQSSGLVAEVPSTAAVESSKGQDADAQAATAHAEQSRKQAVAQAQKLFPEENKDDNNVCADDEELHAGLCYNKCSAMTNDKFSYRQSPWTCCSKKVCGLDDFDFGHLTGCCRHNMGFCSGYAIAGMQEGHKVCPHKPGACLVDEELFLGMCYKKCADLTNNVYPHRVASATCCQVADGTCMFQDGASDGFDGKSLTKQSFNVGGGCGDGSKLTNCKPHAPQQSLTN